MKKIFATVIMTVFSVSAFATCDGGNQCPTYSSGEAYGGGYGWGGYYAEGGAENWSSGEVLERVSGSESVGEVNFSTSFEAHSCDGGCEHNYAQAQGSSTVTQRSFTFIVTDGESAGSSAYGSADSGYDASAYTGRSTSN